MLLSTRAFRSCEVFIDLRFFFSSFFVRPLKQKWHKSMTDMTPKARPQFKTRTRVSTFWLPMESDCLETAGFSSRQLGSVDARKKNKKQVALSPVMIVSKTHLEAGHVSNGESKKRWNCDRTDPSTLQFVRLPAVFPGPFHNVRADWRGKGLGSRQGRLCTFTGAASIVQVSNRRWRKMSSVIF